MSKNRTWERWDDPGVAEDIDRYWSADPSGYETIHRSILAELVQKYLTSPVEQVLEVGCGSGLVYGKLVPQVVVNSCYIGVDISLKMLEIARKRYPAGQFLRSDISHLQFPSNSFDVTLCFEVLGHLPEILKPISELLRVTKRIVIFTVWISQTDETLTETEEIKNSKFIHRSYAPGEIVTAIQQVANCETNRIEIRVLSDKTWAYIIFKGESATSEHCVLPFWGYTDHFIRHQVQVKTELEKVRQELTQSEEALKKFQIDLAVRESELRQARTILNDREVRLGELQEELESHKRGISQLMETLRKRDAELEKLKQEFGNSEEALKKSQIDLGVRESELRQARTILNDRKVKLGELQEELESHKRDLSQALETLKNRDADLGQAKVELENYQDRMRHVTSKAKVIAHELDLFRHGKIIELVNRFSNKTDFGNQISPAFQQLKDDSLIFTRNLKGYRLQPSINLQRVPFVYYPFELNRSNLTGILLAPILDLPPDNGVLGIEIISPSNEIVTQAVISLCHINEEVPTRFEFSPIQNSDKGQFWLRVFVRDTDAQVRVFEWRKYSTFGFGRLQSRAFCGFLFENTP